MTAPIAAIIADAGETLGISPARITGPGRDRQTLFGRWAAVRAARDLLGASQSGMGRVFGRDHTTIRHALIRADRAWLTNPEFRLIADRVVELYHERNPRD